MAAGPWRGPGERGRRPSERRRIQVALDRLESLPGWMLDLARLVLVQGHTDKETLAELLKRTPLAIERAADRLRFVNIRIPRLTSTADRRPHWSALPSADDLTADDLRSLPVDGLGAGAVSPMPLKQPRGGNRSIGERLANGEAIKRKPKRKRKRPRKRTKRPHPDPDVQAARVAHREKMRLWRAAKRAEREADRMTPPRLDDGG